MQEPKRTTPAQGQNGKNLSDITQWMCEKFAVESKVIPITDNTVETRITANGEDLHLQEFWVMLQKTSFPEMLY